jgi:hypothetical protein
MLTVAFDSLWSEIDRNENLKWLQDQPAVKAVIKEYVRERLLKALGPWLGARVTEENVIGAVLTVSADMITYGLPVKMFVAIQDDLREDDEIDSPFDDDEPPDLAETVREAVSRHRQSGAEVIMAEFMLMEPHVFLFMH